MAYPSGYYSALSRLNAASTGIFDALISIGPQIAQAVGAATAETAAEVVRTGQIFEGSVRNIRRSLISVNTDLAHQAQIDILAAYRETHSQLAHSPPYRINPTHAQSRRYADGALESALEDPELVRGTYDGIALVNVAMLNERARQWHRLNFGALPAPGAASRRFNITWDNLVVASVGLDDSPSPAFEIPAGRWFNLGGGDEFYPHGEAMPSGKGVTSHNQRRKPTRGIRAWHFLDAGLESIGNHLSEAYTNLFNHWVEEANHQRGPLANERVFEITPGRIRPSYARPDVEGS